MMMYSCSICSVSNKIVSSSLYTHNECECVAVTQEGERGIKISRGNMGAKRPVFDKHGSLDAALYGIVLDDCLSPTSGRRSRRKTLARREIRSKYTIMMNELRPPPRYGRTVHTTRRM